MRLITEATQGRRGMNSPLYILVQALDASAVRRLSEAICFGHKWRTPTTTRKAVPLQFALFLHMFAPMCVWRMDAPFVSSWFSTVIVHLLDVALLWVQFPLNFLERRIYRICIETLTDVQVDLPRATELIEELANRPDAPLQTSNGYVGSLGVCMCPEPATPSPWQVRNPSAFVVHSLSRSVLRFFLIALGVSFNLV